MDAVTSFYGRLITSESPIEPLLQARIVDHLVRGKEFSLLGKMAARVDLTPEIDARLRDRKEAHVLAGWVSRPGRTPEELTTRLSGEKRVTTLLPLAKMRGLPEHIYREIGKHDSVKLTEALMTNPSVPSDVKFARLPEIVAILDEKHYWQAESLLRETAGDDPALRKALAMASKQQAVIRSCFADYPAGLPADLIANLVGRIEEILEAGNPCEEILARLATEDLDGTAARKLRLIAQRLDKADKQSRSSWLYARDEYAAVKHLLSAKGRADAAKIRRLAVSVDRDESAALLKELLGNGKALDKVPHRDLVYSAAAANTVLPADVVVPLLDQFSHRDEERLYASWAARGELDALAKVALDSYGTPWFLDMVDDQGALLAAVVERARAADEAVPTWVLTHPAVHASPGTALALLPWQSLREVSDAEEFGVEPASPSANTFG